MNKQKALKTIAKLKEAIQSCEPSFPESKIYIDSWVIGSLHTIERKAEGLPYYWDGFHSYKELFLEFADHYFCTHIDPVIKIYALACLFTYEIRDLIIDLYYALISKKDREEMAAHCRYSSTRDNKQVIFDTIRNHAKRI